MAHALAQVRFSRKGGLPKDTVINTFHFNEPLLDLAKLTAITTALTTFYKVAPTGTLSPIQAYLPTSALNAAGHEVRIYDQGDPMPRVPRMVTSFTLDATGGSQALPGEVAMCLSFRGQLQSGIDPKRRRGRVYIGPLVAAAGTATANGDVRPIQAFMDTLVEAGDDLVTNPDCTWSVYSEVGDFLTPVVKVWTDNAYDTQRRRGAAATARTERPV